MKRVRESSKDEKNNGTTKKMKNFVKKYSEALLEACSRGDTDLARMLCSKGADPNATTKGKREPLDEAYLEEKFFDESDHYLEQMTRYIHYGAEKESGLHLASENGHVDIVKMLIQSELTLTLLPRRVGLRFTSQL